MRKARYIPILSVAGGILGLVLRQIYLRRGFEPGTGLPIRESIYSVPMWVFCVVLALALFFLSGGKHECFPKRYTAAFAPPDLPSKVTLLGGAFLMAAAGFLHLWAYTHRTVDILGQPSVGEGRLILGVLALIYLLSMPGIAACFWVVANYQEWAKDPFVDRYMLALFAVVFAMLASAVTAGFGFGNGSVSSALFFSGEATAFCIMILGDGQPLYDVAITLAMVFLFLSQSMALSINDGIPQPPPPPEEEEEAPAGGEDQDAAGGCAGCPSADAQGGCTGCPQETQAPQNDDTP